MRYLDLASYNVREILADGNCLFRELSIYLYATEKHYSRIRNAIVKRVDNWSLLIFITVTFWCIFPYYLKKNTFFFLLFYVQF